MEDFFVIMLSCSTVALSIKQLYDWLSPLCRHSYCDNIKNRGCINKRCRMHCKEDLCECMEYTK